MNTVVILKHTHARTDEIVELTAIGGAEKHPDCDKNNDDTDGDKNV